MAIEKAGFGRMPGVRLPAWLAGAALIALVLAAGGVGAILMATYARGVLQAQVPANTPVVINPAPAVDTVTVIGEGRIVAAPDTVFVDLSAETTGSTLAAAMGAATADTNKLVTALKNASIAPADMQTTGMGAYPRTDSYGRMIGYQASSTLRVRIRNVTRVTAILSIAGGAIGNDIRIGSLQYQRTNISAEVDKARQAAISDAAAGAGSTAKASGRSLGHVTATREQFVGYVGAGQAVTGYGGIGGAGGFTVPTVQSGQGEVVVQLAVTYSLS